jgi:uncharacterized membrane protein YdbT with pleckstrin-like domain
LQDEKVIWTGKPTVLAFYEGLAVGGLLLAISIALLAVPFPAVSRLSAVGMAFGALVVVLTLLRAYANIYTITSRRVCREYRLWAVAVEEAPLEKVTNVVVEQDVVGRAFGFGTVRADTAGTRFGGIIFRGVKKPREVKNYMVEAAGTPLKP